MLVSLVWFAVRWPMAAIYCFVALIVYAFGTGLETSHVIPYYHIVTVTFAPCCARGGDEDRTVSVYQ